MPSTRMTSGVYNRRQVSGVWSQESGVRWRVWKHLNRKGRQESGIPLRPPRPLRFKVFVQIAKIRCLAPAPCMTVAPDVAAVVPEVAIVAVQVAPLGADFGALLAGGGIVVGGVGVAQFGA